MARLVCIGLLSLLAVSARAQVPADTAQVWRVETHDGNEYIGKILERSGGVLRLQTETLGLLSIQEADIVRVQVVVDRQLVGGEVWADNPQATRYFWGPNGYGLKEGEAYFQNVWILFNQVSVGISDHASLGLGLIPVFLWGAEAAPIWLTPKVSIPLATEKVNLGAGALVGTVLGAGIGSEFAGIAYGIATVGSRDRNATFGLGYGFADGEWGRHPAITLSGMIRRGRRHYLLFENYFLSAGGESLAIAMFGGRYVASRLSIDYGGMVPVGSGVDRLLIFPWLAVVVPFGRR
jgi:hypothetical protein